MIWQVICSRGRVAGRQRRLAASACLALALLTGAVLAGSTLAAEPASGWPACGGSFPGDGRSPGMAPEAATGAITIELPGPLQGGPVVDEHGRLYLLADGHLLCVQPWGEIVWSTVVGRADNVGLALGPGPAGATQVYVATADPRLMRAYDATDGSLLWHQFLGTVPLGPPGIHPSGMVLIGGEDGKLRGYSAGGSRLFEASMGSQVRTRPVVGPSGITYVAVRGGVLAALRIDGTEAWRKLLGSAAGSSPAVGPGEQVYLADANGRAWCLDPHGTTLYQTTSMGTVISPPAVDALGRAYYLLAGGDLVRVLPAGTVEHMATLAGPDQARGRLALGSCGSVLYAVGTHAGALSQTGTSLWALTLPANAVDVVLPGPGLAAVSAEDGTLILIGPWTAGAGGAEPGEPDPDQGSGDCWRPRDLIVPAADGEGGWHITAPVLGVDWPTASCPPGAAVYLDIDAGGAVSSLQLMPDTAAAAIDAQGEVSIRLRSISGDGIEQVGAWTTVQIDTERPIIAVTSPEDQAVLPLGTALRPSFEVADGGSGLAAVETLLNGLPFVGSCYPGPGSHLLAIRATDIAGNSSMLTMTVIVQGSCSAVCLNPVLSGPGTSVPPWSRWVTLMVRVPVTLADAGEPVDVTFAGVPGLLVARMPAPLGSGARSFLFRFGRDDIANALAELALAVPAPPRRLRLLHVPATWRVGEQACGTLVQILFRP